MFLRPLVPLNDLQRCSILGKSIDCNLVKIKIHISRDRGILGLFKGLEAKLMQTVLTAALMFLVYEKLLRFISKLLRVELLKIK